jgi:uncharacterized protein YxjI
MLDNLPSTQRLSVKQIFELAEIFSFETRNKYRISDEGGRDVAYAAEQQKGFLGFLMRQFLGHWRSFEIHIFDTHRQPILTAHHPFRWFFQRLEVRDANQRLIGVLERRFSFLTKKFDVLNGQGLPLFEVSSPFWRIWTFPFRRQGRDMARISKKWSGLGYEMFTDRDNFLVEFLDPSLTADERALVLAASIFVDLMYFERSAYGS